MDNQEIREYMSWARCEDIKDRFILYCSHQECCHNCGNYHRFDANDVRLCIQTMWNKGDLKDFISYIQKDNEDSSIDELVMWASNPKIFFMYMKKWRKNNG